MNPIIEVKDVTFTYSGAQRHALERVSLPLRRSWLAVLSVIDYMPGDTLLHKLYPVAKVALATDYRNDPREQKGSRLLDSLCACARMARLQVRCAN